jgi:hypothetical protein
MYPIICICYRSDDPCQPTRGIPHKFYDPLESGPGRSGHLLRSFPAKLYCDRFKTACEMICIPSEPFLPPPDRRIICRHANGPSGIEHGFDAFTAMPLVWYQNVGQFMMDTSAHLTAKPTYPENDPASCVIDTLPLTAANHVKLPATARAGYLLQIPDKKHRSCSFQSVHNLIE